MGVESILAPFVQQAGTCSQTVPAGGSVRTMSTMARVAADLIGSLLAEMGARRHAEPCDLCPTTPQSNCRPRRPLLADVSLSQGLDRGARKMR